MSEKYKKIGVYICVACACACLGFGLFGLAMIEYWHHVTGDWLDDHISWWMMRGMPSTVATFAFTRAVDLFR